MAARMWGLTKWGLGLVFAVLVASSLAGDASARGSRRQAAGYESVSLSAIRGNPPAFIDKPVCFECFFGGLGRIYQPFQTPFVNDQYLNFHVWEPDTRLWDDKERKNAYLFCYVPRDNDRQASYVMSRETYDSIRLYGHVKVVYAQHPWFVVEDIEPSDMTSYSELALKHILVGIKSLKTKDFPMAQESFSEALRTRLPQTAQLFVQRELGRTYYELEMYPEAYEALRKAAPVDGWLARRSGQALSRAADAERDEKRRRKMLEQALELLKKARQLEPANPESHAEMGWVRAKLGEPREGILDCKRANALRQDAGTYRILGKIYYVIGKAAEAENYYQQAIMLDPSSPRHHRELADLYVKQAKFAEAVGEYTNVITLTTTQPDGYILRAGAHKKLGQIEKAIRDYESARSQDSESIEALLGLAATYRDTADYGAARQWINAASRLAPTSIRVLAAKAALLRKQEAFDDAIAEYTRIISEHRKVTSEEDRRELALAYFGLGEALFRTTTERRDPALAAKKLTDAVRLDPELTEARKVIAEAYDELGKYALAVQHLLAAKKLQSGDESVRLMLADALAENDQVEEALKELADLIIERPQSTYAKNNRAYLLAEFRGPADLQEALDLATEARDKDPANPDFLDTLGWVKYKLGDKDDGRILIESAIINTKAPDAYAHLAVIAEEAGETTIAKEHVEEALRLLGPRRPAGRVTGRLYDKAFDLARKVGANTRPGPRSP